MMEKTFFLTLSIYLLTCFFQCGVAGPADYCTLDPTVFFIHTPGLTQLQDFVGRRMYEYRKLYRRSPGYYQPEPRHIACMVAEHAVQAKPTRTSPQCKEEWKYLNYNFDTYEGFGASCCLDWNYDQNNRNNCAEKFMANLFGTTSRFAKFGLHSRILRSNANYQYIDSRNIESVVDSMVSQPNFRKVVVDVDGNEWGANVSKNKYDHWGIAYVTNPVEPMYEKCGPYTGEQIPTINPPSKKNLRLGGQQLEQEMEQQMQQLQGA